MVVEYHPRESSMLLRIKKKHVEIQNKKRISNLTVQVSSAIRNTYYTTVDIQILDKPITAQKKNII